MPTILIVEDEDSLSDPLAFTLQREGYEAIIAETGPQALELFGQHQIDLILLDIMLPGLSGVEVCRQIRATSEVPVIMLTAKDDEIDKVVGLEIGADDYMTKPYSTRELLARIKAVLRRRAASSRDADDDTDEVLTAGPVRMEVERHMVSVNDTAISLPLKEFELLEFLIRNEGRVLTRGQILDRVWGPNYHGDSKTLDVHIKRLRAKIEDDPKEPKVVITVRGLGYKFES